ncbi:MobF family relaxase [Bythopirellula goksoeyrii]|uniref:Multifunctional conjugation protein TraI n=1 Tax=Bythopirellula goksoeyrii TaxID=1400387 RepID=A0A5B9QG55_9BACT|nr:MobF family relaxase [Bythopirellula goksoeyrii]QEG35906.1 Multifunctional conjugation protein TraI [Bythopirellula goksoeyrii]
MLSIKPVGGSATEVSYYAHLGNAENHDYYSENGVRPGVWWGAGSRALGLTGEVDPAELKNILEGLSPDGTKQLVQKRKGEKIQRRAGFDLTWSLPKSFSCAWSLADEQDRKEVDRVAALAVDRALEAFSQLCGVTRRGKDGRIAENAQLVVALFSHDTTRGLPGEAPDPQRHFHAVVANLVIREDGTTGALDARVLFQRRMKMALGALFRSELSMLLETELGIKTYRPQRERSEELVSWFEIEGVPQELLAAMSKRRQAIEKWLRQHGLSGAKAAEKAALNTRNDKELFTWPELQSAWKQQSVEFGFGQQQVAELFGKELQRDKPYQELARATDSALATLMGRKARFTENEFLEQTAIAAQSRGIGIGAVLGGVVKTLEHSPEIVELVADGFVRTFTTRAMLEVEQRLIGAATRLHNKSTHAVAPSMVQEVISRHETLRPEQAQAVRDIATGSDIVAITGVAGSGKTTMLKLARIALEQNGYSVIGTSLASKAAKGLETEAGIASLHIHKLLYEIENGNLTLTANTVLVVDEAGMIGTVQLEKLLRQVEAARAKIVLVGDHKQLQAIDPGAPFRLIGEQIGTTELMQVVRQREAWAREAVLQLRDGNAQEVLEELDRRGQLHIGSEREDALERLVADWCDEAFAYEAKVKDLLVLAGRNRDVRELNRRIQHEMKSRGQLGEYAVEVDGLDIHLGDRVLVTKNSKLHHLRNGTLGEVVGVEHRTVWLRTDEGMEIEINTSEFSHLTLSYAMSIHKSQGTTCEAAFLLVDPVMVDRELSYVAGSRARGNTWVYADRASTGALEQLAVRMSQSRQQEMALEYLPEVV